MTKPDINHSNAFSGLFDRILYRVQEEVITTMLKEGRNKEALSVANMNLQEFNVWRKKQEL